MLQPTPVTLTTKLGSTRAGERSRIWIEGSRLADAGFVPGVRFEKLFTSDALVLTIITAAKFAKLPVAERGTVSGKGDKPIIDIVGAKVIATFAPATHVIASYRRGVIVIEQA